MKVTIKDVAEKADVSIATVSRVINNPHLVTEKVRERVLEVINELGFRPNPVARSLVMKKNRLIGVIVPELSNFFVGEIMNGIDEIIHTHEYDIIVCHTRGDHEQEIRYLDIFYDKQAEGIIFMTWNLDNKVVEHISKMDIPVVMINRNTSNLAIPSVSIDNYKAAYEMTQYLLKKGHRKIALIRNSIDVDAFGLEQYKGYKQALSEYGIEVNEKYIRYGNFSMDNSYKIVMDFIEEKIIPTAIFCTSDIMAIGAINALKDSGYKVPEEVSVVGFNDVRLASIYRPRLTVIHQPLFNIGSVAVKMIIDRIKGKNSGENIVILPHRLIERESSSSSREEN
ncbi:MAG: LacI family transcriptional regulator [Clostridiales bacterium]|nr:LacI family transcriptional regulator [Clostridiales bacterium]